MRAKFWVAALVGTVLVLALCVPAAHAQAPVVTLPGQVQISQAYVDALTAWYKYYYPEDWESHLKAALSIQGSWQQNFNNDSKPMKAPVGIDTEAISEQVTFTGVPATTWWMDLYRMELNGKWNKATALHPASQLPGPVIADVLTQGYLPGVYVVRACDRGGSVLDGPPSLMVVSWTRGTGGAWPQIFDLPTLPDATPAELADIKM